MYRLHFPQYELTDCGFFLNCYNGFRVPTVGTIHVPVTYRGETTTLPLVVVRGSRPCLLGRDWLFKLKLDWKHIFERHALHQLSEETELDTSIELLLSSQNYPAEFKDLIRANKELFSEENLGIKGFKASLKIKDGARPIFKKARPVPYALVQEVEKAYDSLIHQSLLYPVTHSAWASPVVHVEKPTKEIRVCGDYKALNEVLEDDPYKMPNVEDLFAELTLDGHPPDRFTVLDLTKAYHQVFMDEESSQYLTLNTRKGLLGSNRLTYGVKTAPAQFQRILDKILVGMPGVRARLDDILIATHGGDEAHMKVLLEVFNRLTKYNVKLKLAKAQFMKTEVVYMGYKLTTSGISPIQSKLQAIIEAPKPTNKTELKAFLGMLNYYRRFLPNLSAKLAPLYKLTEKNQTWYWDEQCESVFEDAKQLLSSDKVLIHYQAKKNVYLRVDASAYGLGAVLCHKVDGTYKPIAFASRTLQPAEKKYAQIEKEALAIIFGVKRFHNYLYGRHFSICTDHKPLTRIFGPKYNIPTLAAARMTRWALLLSGYNFDIESVRSRQNAEADCLSRLPLSTTESDADEECMSYVCVDQLPVTAQKIALATQKDTILCKVFELTSSGWPQNCTDPELEPYFSRRGELSIEDGCLMWGTRVIIPSVLQHQLLDEMHECHPGICKMKALARSYVWWADIDSQIETLVHECVDCSNAQNSPKENPLLLWPWATRPWQRVHIDYLDCEGKQFLLVVDSYSKWLEVFRMHSTTATATINRLRTLFSSYGLPEHIVSDNGPQFIADNFKTYLRMNGVKQTLTPPYHPASNGLAERHVQTFKRMFKKAKGENVEQRLARVLFVYRNLQHRTTSHTPAELFLGRRPRSRLSLAKPDLRSRVEGKQQKAKDNHDCNPKFRLFGVGQRVKVHNFRGKVKWVPGRIAEVTGRSTYRVSLPNGQRLVHIDQMIRDDTKLSTTMQEVDDWEPSDNVPLQEPRPVSGTNEHVIEILPRGSPLSAPSAIVSPQLPGSALLSSPTTVAIP